MTKVKETIKGFDFETLIEFTRSGIALNADVLLRNYLENGGLNVPNTLEDILDIPDFVIPSILAAQNPDNPLLTEKAFIFCDPNVEIQPTLEECENCRKNPIAFVEDWTQKTQGTTFFNARDCTLNAVVNTGYFGSLPRGEDQQINRSFLELMLANGIQFLIKSYNKSDTITTVTYKPTVFDDSKTEIARQALSSLIPVGLISRLIGGKLGQTMVGPGLPGPRTGFDRIVEEFDTVEQLLPVAGRLFNSQKNVYVPVLPGEQTKILVTIPVEIFNKIPEALVSEPKILENSEFDSPFEVKISGADFKKIFKDVGNNVKRAAKYAEYEQSQGFRFYNKPPEDSNAPDLMVSDYDPNKPDSTKSTSVPRNINFFDEGERLRKFKDDYIVPMLGQALGLRKADLEYISFLFKFNNPEFPRDGIKISEIIVKKFGCNPVEIFKEGLLNKSESARNLFYYSNQIVLGYLAALPDMYYYLSGQEEPNWIEFLSLYTYPGLVLKDPETLLTKESPFEDFRCLANVSANKILDSLISKGLNSLNLLNGAISAYACSRLDAYRKEYNVTVESRRILEIILRQSQNANLYQLLKDLGLNTDSFSGLTSQGGELVAKQTGPITGKDAKAIRSEIQTLFERLRQIKIQNSENANKRRRLAEDAKQKYEAVKFTDPDGKIHFVNKDAVIYKNNIPTLDKDMSNPANGGYDFSTEQDLNNQYGEELRQIEASIKDQVPQIKIDNSGKANPDEVIKYQAYYGKMDEIDAAMELLSKLLVEIQRTQVPEVPKIKSLQEIPLALTKKGLNKLVKIADNPEDKKTIRQNGRATLAAEKEDRYKQYVSQFNNDAGIEVQEINANFKEAWASKRKELRDFIKEKPLVSIVVEALDKDPKNNTETLTKLTKAVNDTGGWCGWVKLITEASQCIIKGLDAPDFKTAIIKSILKNLTPWQFQKVFKNFPPDARDRVVKVLRKEAPNLICGLFPWECDFGSTSRYEATAPPPRGILVNPGVLEGTSGYSSVEAGLQFPRINFDFGKSTLRSEDSGEIQRWVKEMSEAGYFQDSGISLKIVGHTDTVASEGFNQKLSEQRAKVVREALLSYGFPKNQLSSESSGEKSTLVDLGNEVRSDANRRVDFFLATNDKSTESEKEYIQSFNEAKKLKDEQERKAELAAHGKASKSGTDAAEGNVTGQTSTNPPTTSEAAKQEAERRATLQLGEGTEGSPGYNQLVEILTKQITDQYNKALQDFADYQQIGKAPESDNYIQGKIDSAIQGIDKSALDYSILKYGYSENKDDILRNYEAARKEIASLRKEQEELSRIQAKQREMKNSVLGAKTALAVQNITNELTDILIDTMLDIIGIDTLFEAIRNVPGFNIVKKFIKSYSCLIPENPLFDPPLNEFLKTLRFDLCHIGQKGWIDMTIPDFKNPFPVIGKAVKDLGQYTKNLFLLLTIKAKQMFLELASQMLLKMITTIIQALLDFLCTLAGDAAAALQAAITGNSKVKTSLKTALCGSDDLDDKQFAQGLQNIAAAVFSDNSKDSDCVGSITNREMAEFLDSVFVTLNYGQIYDLLLGSASTQVIETCNALANASNSNCIRNLFGNPDKLANYFKGVGTLLDAQKVLASFPTDILLTDAASVCPPNSFEALNQFRANLLSNKGLTPEEVRDQLELLKEQASKKLEDLANALTNGPYAEMPPMFGDDLCPPNGIIRLDPAISIGSDLMAESIFGPIERKMVNDLAGDRGVVSRVLSDTNGRSLKVHKMFRRLFGNDLGEENTDLEFYSDNTMRITSVSQDGELIVKSKRKDRIDQFGRPVLNNQALVAPQGGYPPTVAAYLMRKLQKMSIGLIDKSNASFEVTDFYPSFGNDNKFPMPSFKTRRVSASEVITREDSIERNRAITDFRRERISLWAIATGFIDASYASRYIKSFKLDEATINLTKTSSQGNVKSQSGPNLGPTFGASYLSRIQAFNEMINACNKDIFGPQVQNYADYTGEKRVNNILGNQDKPQNRQISVKSIIFTLNKIIKELIEEKLSEDKTLSYETESVVIAPGIFMTKQMMEFYLISWYSYDLQSDYYVPMMNQNELNANKIIFTPRVGDSITLPNIAFDRVQSLNPYELGFTYISYPKANRMKPQDKKLAMPDYSFDLTYDMNLESEKDGTLDPSKRYKYRVVLTESINPFNDQKNDSSTRAAQRQALQEASLNQEDEDSSIQESSDYALYSNNSETIRFFAELDSTPSQQIKDFADTLMQDSTTLDLDYSFETETFLRFMGDRLIRNLRKPELEIDLVRRNVRNISLKESNKDLFDFINEGFVRRLTKRIGNGDGTELIPEYDTSLKEEEPNLVVVPKAFRFGYDPDIEPEVILLDPTVYGGSESNPPFYVKPPAYKGWLGILDLIIPEQDACEPMRVPLYRLEDAKSKIRQNTQRFVSDQRIGFDPLCNREAPFDPIFDNTTMATLDALISATARVYTLDVAMKMMPLLTEFALNTDKNFDNLLSVYISEYALEIMKRVDNKRLLKQVGRKIIVTSGLPKDEITALRSALKTPQDKELPKFVITNDKEVRLTYYYGFLEQVYYLISKKIQSGLLDPATFSQEEKDSFDFISSRIDEYYVEFLNTEATLAEEAIQAQDMFVKAINPAIRTQIGGNLGLGSANFDKIRAKKIKNALTYSVLRQCENQAKMLFGIYVREEMSRFQKILNQKFKPNVENLDLLFMSSEEFINGNVSVSYDDLTGEPSYSQPYDIMKDPFNSKDFNINLNKFTNSMVTNNTDPEFKKLYDSSTDNQKISLSRKWPFVLEKYIVIDEKSADLIKEQNSYVYNKMVERDILLKGQVNMQEFKNFVDEILAESPQNDRKFSDVFGPTNKEDQKDDPRIFSEISGLRFGVRLSMYLDQEDPAAKHLSAMVNEISEETIKHSKAYRVINNNGKQSILFPIANGELPVKDQYFSQFDLSEFDLVCTLNELLKSQDFRFMFDFLFPYKRYLSLLGIYVANSFYDAIGNIGAPSQGGDRWTIPAGKKATGFRRWDKESAFYDPGVIGPDTANILMSSFLAVYRTRNKFTTSKTVNKMDTDKSLKDLIMDAIPDEIFKSIPWYMKRNQVNRPYDAFDQECQDMNPEEEL